MTVTLPRGTRWIPVVPPPGATLPLLTGGRLVHLTPIPDAERRLSTAGLLDPARQPGSTRGWNGPDVVVLCSIDLTHHGPLLHASISRRDRDPSWAEITSVRDFLIPDDVDAMMVMPRAADYVNIHQHCFHVWQAPAEWRIQ